MYGWPSKMIGSSSVRGYHPARIMSEAAPAAPAIGQEIDGPGPRSCEDEAGHVRVPKAPLEVQRRLADRAAQIESCEPYSPDFVASDVAGMLRAAGCAIDTGPPSSNRFLQTIAARKRGATAP